MEQTQQAFVNGFDFEVEADCDNLIHAEYVDEGAAEDEKYCALRDQQVSKDPIDWRRSSAEFKRDRLAYGDRPDFSRFFNSDWRGAKVGAKHVKLCPGESCRKYLALHNFGSNLNMPDGLDIFCFNCNALKRAERRAKTARFRDREGRVVDKFEQFNSIYKARESKFTHPSDLKEQAIWREVRKRIESAASDADRRYGLDLPVDVHEISRKLFQGGKYVCNITGSVLSKECFLEHHVLTFEVKRVMGRRKLDIICSQCRKCAPPPGFEGQY